MAKIGAAFIRAANFTKGRLGPSKGRDVRFLVVHCTQTACTATSGRNVARWFASQITSKVLAKLKRAPRTSAHVVIDDSGPIQCVSMADTAWAVPDANADGEHFELCGRAEWTTEQWLAEGDMLNWAATCIADRILFGRRFGKPYEVRRLHLPEIARRSGYGIVGHDDCTHAFGTKGGHTDPGAGFPWDVFLAKVAYMVSLLDTPDFRTAFV